MADAHIPLIDFAYRDDQAILFARTRGELHPSSIVPMVKRMTEEGVRHNCRLFVLDHRAAKIRHLDFPEILKALPSERNLALPRGARLAIVLPSLVAQVKAVFETFFKSSGRDVRLFEDEPEAVSWLLGPDIP